LEDLALKVTGSEFVPSEPMRFYRRWFERGGTVGLLKQVVGETLEQRRGQKISSMAYFQRPLDAALDAGRAVNESPSVSEPEPERRLSASEWAQLTSDQQRELDYKRWSIARMRQQFPERYGVPTH
jgi:hypothetical protein